MQLPKKLERPVLYALIFLSGVSGLIYEVVWHRYLAILLGAQARATAIVLAIFLGGISVGYACFGRWTRTKGWNLLRVYVRVELGMAIWAFCFPYVFHFIFPLTAKLYSTLGLNNLVIDFTMALLLIGVPTFLMGGTLPLLTQGLSRDVADASQTHARIYGFNTLGACVGCVAAGYLLIPTVGLIEATRAAGLFNVIVGLTVYLFWARQTPDREMTMTVSIAPPRALTQNQKILLGVGFLSGFYQITLQTVLIRLMGLSMGAANYNFTLIVSIFIFALGIGSLLVRHVGEYKPSRLFWNQLFVAVALLVLYMSGDYWSYWVHRVRLTLRDIPQNFYLYQAMLGVVFSALLLVPIGLSGLTLPLCFHLIKDDKESLGERVGQLYGLNTVGCVMGALVGGYFLLNFFDLDGLFKICVLCALFTAAASAYLYFPTLQVSNFKVVMAGALAGLTLAGTLWWPRYDHRRFVQPFRHPSPTEASFKGADEFGKMLGGSTHFVFWKDDPNTTIGIGASMFRDQEVSRTIFINGKSDGNTRGDQFTTVLLAHIPGLMAKKLDNVCVIGFGTGTTVGQLTLYPEVKQIDVAEISRALIDNSSLFDSYNNHASTSAKVKFNEMDAFRFLEGTNHQFDLIVSEPSNPWVAGIENLYSREFYAIAKGKMGPDSLFVQWIHTYSFSDALMQMVLKTMSTQFPYLSVFSLKSGDIAVIGALRQLNHEDTMRGADRFAQNAKVRQSLLESGVTRYETVLALELVPPTLIGPMTEGIEEHTLESPKLSNESAKAFFAGTGAKTAATRRQWKQYFPSIDSSLISQYLGDKPLTKEMTDAYRFTFCENATSKASSFCEEALAAARYVTPTFVPPTSYEDSVPQREMASLGTMQRLPTKNRFTADDLQSVYTEFDAYKKYYSPIARFSLAPMNARVNYCLATLKADDELFGECLLQRLVMIEATTPPGPEFDKAARAYLDWFPQLPKSAPNRAKLEEARNILVKMMESPK